MWEVGKYYDRYNDNDDGVLRTSDGETCSDGSGDNSGSDSVFYDADRDDDENTCDDIGGSCQRAYVIAMTDGYYNLNFTRSAAQRDDNDSINQNFDKPVPEVFRSSQFYTLGDIAQHFYLKDLSDEDDGGLEDELDPRGFDDATWQHVVTYGVAFGVFGNYNPDDFPDCLPACDTPGTLGCPDINQIRQIQCRNVVVDGETVEECTSGVMDQQGSITFDNWKTEGPYRYVCPDWPEQGDPWKSVDR